MRAFRSSALMSGDWYGQQHDGECAVILCDTVRNARAGGRRLRGKADSRRAVWGPQNDRAARGDRRSKRALHRVSSFRSQAAARQRVPVDVGGALCLDSGTRDRKTLASRRGGSQGCSVRVPSVCRMPQPIERTRDSGIQSQGGLTAFVGSQQVKPRKARCSVVSKCSTE